MSKEKILNTKYYTILLEYYTILLEYCIILCYNQTTYKIQLRYIIGMRKEF